MSRIRTIQPSFPKSPSMGRVSLQARLLFIQLWTVADDAGRLRADVRTLLDQLYPYDTDVAMFLPAWLDELEREGCIERYASDGEDYLRIVRWHKHQKIGHPTPSRLPQSPAEQALHEFHEASRNSRKARAEQANVLAQHDDSDSVKKFHEEQDNEPPDGAEPDTPDAVIRDLARIQRDSHAAESYTTALRSVELRGRRFGLWAGKAAPVGNKERDDSIGMSPHEAHGLPDTRASD